MNVSFPGNNTQNISSIMNSCQNDTATLSMDINIKNICVYELKNNRSDDFNSNDSAF